MHAAANVPAMGDRPLLDHPRLRGHARTPGGAAVFAGIARDWARTLEDRLAALSAAAPAELPDLLHQLRSTATAIGLPSLCGRAAELEQAAERGRPPSPGELEELARLARHSAAEVLAWWAAHPGPRT
jgi:hypothetical protein